MYEKWKELIQKYKEKAPEGMQSLFEASDELPPMTTELALHEVAMKALIVALAVNLVVQPLLLCQNCKLIAIH